jgi:hypothetical protein
MKQRAVEMAAKSKRARKDRGTSEDEAAPRLLCLLLEVREQMRKMDTRLERIGALLERIDARVCRMERSRATHAASCARQSQAPSVARLARGFRRGSARRSARWASWRGPCHLAGCPSAKGFCSARRGPGSSSS